MNYKIIKLIQENKEIRTFQLVPLEGDALDFKAGQFVVVSANIMNDETLLSVKRAYSIANTKNEEHLDITVKHLEGGLMSTYLMTLKEGDILDVTGPFGIFTFEQHMTDLVLIAGGIGIVPIMGIIRCVLSRKKASTVKLFYSVKTQDEVVFEEELKALSKDNPSFEYLIATTRDKCTLENCSSTRINMEFFNRLIKDVDVHHYFICGSPRFVDGMKDILIAEGVEEKNIKAEGY